MHIVCIDKKNVGIFFVPSPTLCYLRLTLLQGCVTRVFRHNVCDLQSGFSCDAWLLPPRSRYNYTDRGLRTVRGPNVACKYTGSAWWAFILSVRVWDVFCVAEYLRFAANKINGYRVEVRSVVYIRDPVPILCK